MSTCIKRISRIWCRFRFMECGKDVLTSRAQMFGEDSHFDIKIPSAVPLQSIHAKWSVLSGFVLHHYPIKNHTYLTKGEFTSGWRGIAEGIFISSPNIFYTSTRWSARFANSSSQISHEIRYIIPELLPSQLLGQITQFSVPDSRNVPNENVIWFMAHFEVEPNPAKSNHQSGNNNL